MTPPAAPPRKRAPGPKPDKAAAPETIRVAKAITPVVVPKPKPPVFHDPEEELAPEPPCSGRCGHCHHHPCRLHGGV